MSTVRLLTEIFGCVVVSLATWNTDATAQCRRWVIRVCGMAAVAVLLADIVAQFNGKQSFLGGY